MTPSACRRGSRARVGAMPRRTRMAVASIGVLAIFGAGVSVEAPTAIAAKGTKAIVVHKAKRGTFGKILVTASSLASLYFAPGNICTGSCLVIWPPLLMPTGTTVPKGSSGWLLSRRSEVEQQYGRTEGSAHDAAPRKSIGPGGNSEWGQLA